MTGIVNSTGARSGVIGTTVGTPAPTGFFNIQSFTTGTGATYTKTAGTTKILVHCGGGGGGGGGYSGGDDGGGGGGSGATAIKLYDYSSLTTGTYTVGIAGTAGSGHGNGGHVNVNSTFTDGTTVITGGGGGGGNSPNSGRAAGAAGAAINGDINIPGVQGEAGIASQGEGNGGKSYWGGFGNGGRGATQHGAARQSEVGTAGVIVIYEYK